MGRRIFLEPPSGATLNLEEVSAENEKDLQKILRDHPELLPLEDMNLRGDMMVIGRETTTRSGLVDLLGLTLNGEIIIIEFKTGSKNPDYRHSLAQLLDYGSELWQSRIDVFADKVVRFLNGSHCSEGAAARGATSLDSAVRAQWPQATDEDLQRLRPNLERALQTGTFDFVIAAQHVSRNLRRTVDYLNDIAAARFHGAEVVKFQGSDGTIAHEGRIVAGPRTRRGPGAPTTVNRDVLLQAIADSTYAEVIESVFDQFEAEGCDFGFGAGGTSFRVIVPDHTTPLSVGWFFPPGGGHYHGMKDLTLGVDTKAFEKVEGSRGPLRQYLEAVASLGGEEKTPGSIQAWSFTPEAALEQHEQILDAIHGLLRELTIRD